jgi:hypothetical protein
MRDRELDDVFKVEKDGSGAGSRANDGGIGTV